MNSVINLEKLDSLKNTFYSVLEKKNLSQTKAKVCLALDVTESMVSNYKEGVVQNVIERIFAIAETFDDDGDLDLWIYDHRHQQLAPVSRDNIGGYVEKEILVQKEKFGKNFECRIMQSLLETYTGKQYPKGYFESDPSPRKKRYFSAMKLLGFVLFVAGLVGFFYEIWLLALSLPGIVILLLKKPVKKDARAVVKKSQIPVYIVFISDGNCNNYKKCMQRIIAESSGYPIFWQFVGLGNKGDYGLLNKLDNFQNRKVDNSDFFIVDDIVSMPDEVLYQKLFNEFPDWIKKARELNIMV